MDSTVINSVITKFLNFLILISLKPIFLNKDITMKGDKILFFSGPLNFTEEEIYCIFILTLCSFIGIKRNSISELQNYCLSVSEFTNKIFCGKICTD